MAENPEDLIVTDAELRRQLPALADELGIGGGVDGSVPIFVTLAEAEAWEAVNPGRSALTTEDLTPDTTDPVWTAALTVGVPGDSSVAVTASEMAQDDRAVVRYEVTYDGTTWQKITPDGKTFTLAGLPGTTYSATKLRAVDAAGNAATRSVPPYTLATAPPAWRPVVTDMFDGPQGTALPGRTATTGGTWADKGSTAAVLDGAGDAICNTATGSATNWVSSSGAAKMRASVVYAFDPGKNAQLGVGLITMANGANHLKVIVDSVGRLSWVDYAGGAWTMAGTTTGHPTSGTLTLEMDGAAKTGRVLINGDEVATITGDVTMQFFGPLLYHYYAGSRASSVTCEVWQ
ncbi:hypothetical protein V1463_10430 [Micrococcus yunnanensis]|uniref:hypothetical protein n=1 Tax=Micrococcus yunnanensis TaxID=566027 RepID=UPI00300DE504